MSHDHRSQHDHFTIKGYWWLPSVGRKIAGELSYTESDLILTLYGGLSDFTLRTPFSGELNEPEHSLIHGETEDNVPFTVMQAFYTEWKPDFSTQPFRPESSVELRTSRLHCRIMIEGVHLSSVEETFDKCRLQLPSLDVWLGIEPFVFDMKRSYSNMSIEYTLPQMLRYDVEVPACSFSFVHGVTPPGYPLGVSPAILHSTFLEIKPSLPRTCKELFELFSGAIDMLSVIYGGPLVASRSSLVESSQDKEFPVFYPRHENDPKEYKARDFLIPFSEIKDCFSEIIRKWMNPTTQEKRARQILISTERRPADFMELRFLPLVHAIEVLSNEAANTTIIPDAEFKKLVRKMIEAVNSEASEETVRSIKASLSWANGRSLRDKMRSLLLELQDGTWRLFAFEKEAFLGGVVRTRNHYTHYSTKKGERLLQGIQLHWGIQKLSLMIRVFLLLRAGVPESVIQTSVGRHYRLAGERKVWSTINEEGSEFACSR